MDKARLQKLIDRQIDHVDALQHRFGELTYDHLSEEWASLQCALSCAVSTLAALNSMMPDEEDTAFEVDIKKSIDEARERIQRKREERKYKYPFAHRR